MEGAARRFEGNPSTVASNVNDHRFSSTSSALSPEVARRSQLHGIQEESDRSQAVRETVMSYNPFEEVESLHLPKLSPSIFSSVSTPDRKSSRPHSFRWSIEQLATLHPVDIEEDLHANLCHDLDSESEAKAQEAIDRFFSQNLVVPSPWSGSARRVIYSSNLASTPFKTGFREDCINMAIDCDKNDACTQTVLSVPPDVDLRKCLGEYFLHRNSFEDQNEHIEDAVAPDALERFSSSFLRRKLLFHGEGDMENNNEWSSPSRQMSSPVAYSTPEKPKRNFGNLFGGQLPCSPLTVEDFNSLSVIHHSPCFASPSLSPISKTIYKNCAASRNREREVKSMTLMKRNISRGNLCLDPDLLLSAKDEKDKRDEKIPIHGAAEENVLSSTEHLALSVPADNVESAACSVAMETSSGFMSVSMMSVSQFNTQPADSGECKPAKNTIHSDDISSMPPRCVMKESAISLHQNFVPPDTGYQSGNTHVTSGLSCEAVSGFHLYISPATKNV